MGAALPFAAVAMQAAAPMVAAIGENKELRTAARVDEENARLSLLAGEQEVGQTLRDERQLAGDALSAMAGSGVMIGSGSPADIIMESARQREREIIARRGQARGEQRNYLQASKDKRAAGRNALIQGAFAAVSTALNGADSIRQRRVQSHARDREREQNRPPSWFRQGGR